MFIGNMIDGDLCIPDLIDDDRLKVIPYFFVGIFSTVSTLFFHEC